MAETLKQVADKADRAISSTRRTAHDVMDTLEQGVDRLRDEAPGVISRTAAQVEDIARRGIERARQTGVDVRDTFERNSERTVGYIKDEPVKSVLMAAAAGALLAGVFALLTRDRSR